MAGPLIGGAPLVRLRASGTGEGPRFLTADVAPGRGMLLVQARAWLPGIGEFDLLATPPLDEAARRLDGDPFGNAAFGLGGAILLPFANRIAGHEVGDEIETQILGRTVRLPANWGGKAPGARRYAMHGLLLDRAMDQWEVSPDGSRVRGVLQAGDFGGRWPSRTDLTVEVALEAGALSLTIEARNAGDEPLPMGIGWHPWFNLPSGDRRQARLRVPARGRTVVNNYDEVLPTGEVLPLAGTPYDVSRGAALGDLYLDDCFVDLQAPATVEVVDPAARFGLRIGAVSPPVKAFQVYAPPDRAVVVVEPQFNLADPFGPQWAGRDTGMVVLAPGEAVTYAARVELFTPEP